MAHTGFPPPFEYMVLKADPRLRCDGMDDKPCPHDGVAVARFSVTGGCHDLCERCTRRMRARYNRAIRRFYEQAMAGEATPGVRVLI